MADMPESWSREEVEATVAAYLDMLDQELRGISFNKSDARRRLAVMLNGRSEGAIERKHQNISAILIELGFPYVSGYKRFRTISVCCTTSSATACWIRRVSSNQRGREWRHRLSNLLTCEMFWGGSWSGRRRGSNALRR